jgi:hypothetical protein
MRKMTLSQRFIILKEPWPGSPQVMMREVLSSWTLTQKRKRYVATCNKTQVRFLHISKV